MKKIVKQIKDLIEINKENLLDSHLRYGGVYLAKIEEDDETSIEVELDEGSIAFSLKVSNASCSNCGSKEFIANQVVRVSVIVDSDNNFIRNTSKDMSCSVNDADNPYGTYICNNCDEEFEDLEILKNNIDNVYGLLEENLKLSGIGVYTSYSDFEEKILN